MNVQPLADRVFVAVVEAAETMKAGIIIPGTVEKDKIERGEVVATGPGRMLDSGSRAAMSVKPGDKVLFKKSYSSDKFKLDDKELLIVDESDIIAVLA